MKLILIFLLFFISAHITAQVITMEKVGRTYRLPCTVNGLSLNFILDTGADEVSISLSEAIFMLKNGYIDENDLLNSEYYQLANGEIVEGTKLVLRTLKIGGLTIKNVEASIVHTMNAPLLLGQSALSKLGKITIDYAKNQLIINEQKEVYANSEETYEYYIFKGNEYFNEKKYIEALKYYNTAIELNPKSHNAYFGKGISYECQHKYDLAIQEFNKAIKLKNNFVRAYDERGKTFGKKGDFERAIYDFDRAININEKYVDAYCNRSKAKIELGKKDDALIDLKKAIEISPNHALSLINRGKLYMDLKSYQLAIIDFNKVIELNPKNSEAYYSRGHCHYLLNHFNESIIDLNKSIELNPSYDKAFYIRGAVKYDSGDKEGACSDWERALGKGNQSAQKLIDGYCN
jgi:clan AA aspartic protease (TIGR02281 family)